MLVGIVGLTDVAVVFVANVPDKPEQLQVNVCVKLELALVIVMVDVEPIFPFVAVTVDFRGIVFKVNEPLPVLLIVE